MCVGRDSVDDDWQVIVKRGEFLSMQHFVEAEDRGPRHAAICVSLPSRDAAVERAGELIEELA
jgi:hypothetical protein